MDKPDTRSQTAPCDASSFGQYIRAHDQKLRSVAWAVVRDTERTDDVMQIAYEKAYRQLPTFDGRASFSTWIHSIVYRSAIDLFRYERRRQHSDLDSAVSNDRPATDNVALSGLGRLELSEALAQLAPEERAALMLVAGLGHSYDETAEILGEPRGTVAARVSRARSRLERWSV